MAAQPSTILQRLRAIGVLCLAMLLLLLGAPPAEAALFANASVTPTTAAQGVPTVLTYTLSVTNSSSVADDLSLAHTLPAFTTYTNGVNTTQVRINGVLVSTANPSQAGAPPTLTWNNGGAGFTVATGQTLTVTFTATLNSAVNGTFASSFTATDLNGFDAPAMLAPTCLVTIGDPPSLSASKSVFPAAVAVGGTATYTVTVNNFGATATSGLRVVDTLPAGFTYQAGSSVYAGGPIGDPAIAGQMLTWSIPATAGLTEVPANTSRVLTFGVTAPGVNGTFENNVNVSANNAVVNNSGPTASLQVGAGASISVCKASGIAGSTPGCGATATVLEGATYRYMITITNTSITPVTISSVVDNRPNGTGFFTGSANVSVNGGAFAALQDPSVVGNVMTWSGGAFFPRNLPAGQTLRIRWNHRAPIDKSGTFFNTATVNTSNTGQVSTGPTAAITIDGPVIGLTKTVIAPGTATIGAGGGTVTYQITMANTGTVAGQLNVTDILPTGWTYVNNSSQRSINGAGFAAMPNPGIAGTNLTWTNDGVGPAGNGVLVPAGQNFRIRFQVSVSAGYTPGQYPNNVQVAERIFVNNDLVLSGDTAPVTVVGAPQTAITKTVNPSQVLAFQTVQYTIRLRNASGAAANSIVSGITDTLPTGFNLVPGTCQLSNDNVTYAAFQNPAGTFGTLIWSGGPGFNMILAPGQDRYLRFTVQASGLSGTYDNNATVQGVNFADVSTGATATVTVGTPPAISVCKGAAAVGNLSACGGTVIVASGGGQVTYTITAGNTGGIDGQAASLTDTLPAGFSVLAGTSQVSTNGGPFVAITDPSPLSGTVTWPNTFTVPAGGSVRVRFNAQTAAADGSYSNTATAAGTNFSPTSSGPTATVTVGFPPNVTLPPGNASVTPNTVAVGNSVSYTYEIDNAAGSTAAQGVTFSAILPQFMAVVPGSTQVSVNGAAFAAAPDPGTFTGTVTWTGLPNVTGGQNIRIRYNVAVDALGTGGTYLVEGQSVGSNYAATSIGDPSSGNIPPLVVTAASAVDLLSFNAEASSAGVSLIWRTGSEWRNLGYNLYRADAPHGQREQLNTAMIGGLGTTQADGAYRFDDVTAVTGQTYYYWLEDAEFGGSQTLRGPLPITVPNGAGTAQATYTPGQPISDGGATPLPVPAPTSSANVAQYLTIVSQDDQSIVLELKTPDVLVQQFPEGTLVAIPGLPVITEPGQPMLPEAVVPLGAPRDVPYQLEVLAAEDPVILQDLTLPVTPASPGGGSGNPHRPQPGVTPDPQPSAAPPDQANANAQPGSAAPVTPVMPTEAMAALQETMAGRHMQFAFGVLSAGSVFPAELAEVGAQADVRDTRILQLKLYPVQYEAAAKKLTQYRTLRVRLSFQGATQLAAATAQTPWELAMNKLAAEYGLIQRWVSAPATVTDSFVRPTGNTWRLTVTTPGMQTLTAADLSAAGVPLDSPDLLQLTHRNDEVPLDVVAANGQVEALHFHCPQVVSAYDDKAYYLLSVGPAPGLRMPQAPAAVSPTGETRVEVLQSLHVEENVFYWANKPVDEHQDHWFWQTLAPGQDGAVPFALGQLPTDPGLSATLTLGLRGASADAKVRQNHHVQVKLNGALIADLRWPGQDYLKTTVGFAQELLQNGANTLTFTEVGDTGATTSVAYLDGVDLTYTQPAQAVAGRFDARFERLGDVNWAVSGFSAEPQIYDVTRPAAPRRLSGGSFNAGTMSFQDGDGTFAHRYALVEPGQGQAPAINAYTFQDELHAPPTGADWIVITPTALKPAAQTLAQHRQSQGLATKVVDVADAYAEFGGGHPEPEAIHAFVKWAVANWPAPKPSYVVFLGDGHFDYHNHYGTSPAQAIPPLLRDNPSIGTVANENGYAAVVGEDQLPDLFLGRLPATTLADAQAIVAKLIAYDQQPDGAWMGKGLYVSDDDDPAFETFADSMAQRHAGQLAWHEAHVTNGANVRAKLKQGNGLTLYVGHGYLEGWASEEAFSVWRSPGTSDLDSWTANDETGVFVTANCLNGYFHDPDYPSLGEELLRAPHKGAVGFWGTGGYTVPAAQFMVTRRFLRYVLDEGLDLGAASTLAKIGLFLDDSPYWREEMAAWVLLGDPATKLRRLP